MSRSDEFKSSQSDSEVENSLSLQLQTQLIRQLNHPQNSRIDWQEVTTSISEITDTERVAIVLSNEVKASGTFDFWDSTATEEIAQFEDAIARLVIKSGQPYCCNDSSESELLLKLGIDRGSFRNISSVPLIVKDKILGALLVINKKNQNVFSSDDGALLEILAGQVALAIDRDIKEKQLERSNMLLAEIHHRLKNNLSTIMALIEMEIERVDDQVAEKLLQKTIVRIASMMQVHDLLNSNHLSGKLDLKLYFDRLIKKINSTIKPDLPNINVVYDAESVIVNTSWAINCGLLLNELLVNCYKHAFSINAEDARIHITLQEKTEKIKLGVSDNGKGIKEKLSADPSESIGGWLIDVLLRSLDGAMKINGQTGSEILIEFPKNNAK